MAYYTIKKGSKRLSAFYPNDINGVFKFKKNNWIVFDEKKDAEHFIERANKTVENEKDRYGKEYYKKNKSIAKNLKVEKESYKDKNMEINS